MEESFFYRKYGNLISRQYYTHDDTHQSMIMYVIIVITGDNFEAQQAFSSD